VLKEIDGHVYTGFGQAFGNGAANADARASHESNFSVEVVHGDDLKSEEQLWRGRLARATES
jgi:hypothetical protein